MTSVISRQRELGWHAAHNATNENLA